jgi:5-methylcytosine-specific restriction endonuclease McrA
MEPENDTKRIMMPSMKPMLRETDDSPLPPTRKKITTTQKWTFLEADFLPENQRRFLDLVQRPDSKNLSTQEKKQCECILQEIKKKRQSYKSQDVQKNLYDSTEFVSLDKILELLKESHLQCYYCKESILVFYSNVREPKQWSLDRIDNSMGHNQGNLFIACLSCNLKRKTMYHERWRFTKEIGIVQKKI